MFWADNKRKGVFVYCLPVYSNTTDCICRESTFTNETVERYVILSRTVLVCISSYNIGDQIIACCVKLINRGKFDIDHRSHLLTFLGSAALLVVHNARLIWQDWSPSILFFYVCNCLILRISDFYWAVYLYIFCSSKNERKNRTYRPWRAINTKNMLEI